MAERQTEKRGAVVALAAVAAAVWAAVAWTAAGGGEPTLVPAPPVPAPEQARGPVEPRPYTALFRDPFEPQATGLRRTDAPPSPAVQPRPDAAPDAPAADRGPLMTFEEALDYRADSYEAPDPYDTYEPPSPPDDPALTFRGVVGDRAIFEDALGAGFLVAVGDRVGGARVTRVTERLVVLEVDGYEFLYDVPSPPRR